MLSLPSDWNIPGTIGFSYALGQPAAILCGPTTYSNVDYDFTKIDTELLQLSLRNILLIILPNLTFVYTEKHANTVPRPMPVVQATLPQFSSRDCV